MKIGFKINDSSFEQDVRALLMAFYPGCQFAFPGDGTEDLFLVFAVSENRVSLQVRFADSTSTEQNMAFIDSSRSGKKSSLKRLLYHVISRHEEKELPWGTLTGIRPVKLVMELMAGGLSEAEVKELLKETYLISDEKLDLCMKTAKKERAILKGLHLETGWSLYIGIPFCPTTCLYCSFTSYPIGRWQQWIPEYFQALFQELDYIAEKMKGRPLDTIYFGGGTPTSISAADLDILLTKVNQTFPLSMVQEYTVEAGRPDSITEEKLLVLKKHGVSRISINPQTMKDETLKLIGRSHSVQEVKSAFHLARSLGFDNINMDLIVGLLGEDINDVRNTMEEIMALGPDSITVHSLALKRAARLNLEKDAYKDFKSDNTDETIALTRAYAEKMGLWPYYLYRQKNMTGNFENVGYAKAGKEGIYNILIMEEKQTIIAAGAGSTTKVCFPAENRLERVENVKDVDQYIQRIGEMLLRKEKLLAKI